MNNTLRAILALACAFQFSVTLKSSAYSVTQLTALYQSGQVFLTWQNASATNLQYNVYRSSNPISSSTQLTSTTYLGYVRDNSAQNLRKSQVLGQAYYLVIRAGQAALGSDRGLYVATCASNGIYYYAVTVTDLSNNIESKTISAGNNSLLIGVTEVVATPQPILQTITTQSIGDISYEYVLWGNNQDLPHWHAFNNLGSYGYNFTLQTRGNNLNQPLYVEFQDVDPFTNLDINFCADCNMLQLDDRLPNGQSTYWIGYNDHYNMYMDNIENPVVTSGTIKTYTQVLTQAIIRWARRQPGIDSTRTYMTGTSHNGFGCLLTAMNMPSEIAAIYTVVAPILYKTMPGNSRERLLCKSSSNLLTDVNYPGTNTPMNIWNFCDMRTYYRINSNGIPYAQGINGKNDNTVGWIEKYHWYDTLNAYRQGGTWFWDQRAHGTAGANFTDDETTTNYSRFYTNRSYPAFANCSINQNPGTGLPSDGDPYGAINGYVDWKDYSIADLPCSYTITCAIKNFYVGGQLSSQYNTCASDVTLRRLQQFRPALGKTINWTNYTTTNHLLQSGSFVYNGGPITLYGVTIKKSGSVLTLNIVNCRMGENETSEANETDKLLTAYPNPLSDATTISFSLPSTQRVSVKVYDLTGRLVSIIADATMNEGEHQLKWYPSDEEASTSNGITSGLYLLRMETDNASETLRLSVMK